MKNKLNTSILSLSQYLAAAGGNHEQALSALHRDAEALRTEAADLEPDGSIRARAIAAALQPLADAFGIDLPEPGTRPSKEQVTAIEQAVEGALDGVAELEESRDTWMGLAAEAGLDLDALEAAKDPDALDAVIGGWLEGIEGARSHASTAAQELNVYKFAHAHGLNPEALLLQKGLEHLEEREIETTGADGKPVKTKTWGIAGEGDTFTPALEHLKPVLSALKGTQAPAGTPWVTGQEGKPAAGGSAYDQYLREQGTQRQPAYVDPLQPAPASAAAPITLTPSTTQGA